MCSHYAAPHWTPRRLWRTPCQASAAMRLKFCVVRGAWGCWSGRKMPYPRHCCWRDVADMRGQLTAYHAQPLFVKPAEGQPRVAAAATLRDVVMSCLELAQATEELEMPSCGEIPVVLCPDATLLWRTSATRCDVYVGCWKGGPAAAGQPHQRATWWVMDGGDDTHPLRAINDTASLNAQVQAVESALDILVPGHGVARFRCHITGDAKGMAPMKHAPGKKCWCCDDASSLQPTNAVAPTPRRGRL